MVFFEIRTYFENIYILRKLEIFFSFIIIRTYVRKLICATENISSILLAHFSRQNYKNDMIHSFEDEIIYGIYSHEGGCMSEMCTTWEKLGNVTVPYLRSFSESFSLLMSPTHKKFLRQSINGGKNSFHQEIFQIC